MKNKFFKRQCHKLFWNSSILLILLFNIFLFPQARARTNLDVFYSLTDSLVDRIVYEIPFEEKEILLTLNLGEAYSLFANQIRARFENNDKKILVQPPDELSIPVVDIVLEGAGVEYGEIYRDGWFGTHYMSRYSTIFGNYFQSFSETRKIKFEFSTIDTVKVEDIKFLENESFPFTQSNIPPEPFLSGLAEPLIAIGVAAAIIVVFFTVRSE
jgi:hypothetical protein